MKMSLCQMVAIVCILAVGFLTVTPFVPEAHADKYISTINNTYQHTYCGGPNAHLLSVTHLGTGATWSDHEGGHKNGEEHPPQTVNNVIFPLSTGELCSICEIVIPPQYPTWL